METQVPNRDLFGNEIDVFVDALHKYGQWPLTVWDRDASDGKMLRELIGDSGNSRKECFTRQATNKSVYAGKVTESIFDPGLACIILNCWAPKVGMCFDPFAGGGTRGIIAAKYGLNYLGIDIRPEEVIAVRERFSSLGVSGTSRIELADARFCWFVPSRSADFLLTCPPYWNLERYGGPDGDLSMIDNYEEFLSALKLVISQTERILKPGSHSCWVVGMHRKPNGELVCMNHDVAAMHGHSGFTLKEEVVIARRNNGAIQRVGNFEKGNRFLVRTHEYLLTFVRK